MTGAQLTNCMLVSRTADSWLNLENECTSCQVDLEVQDKRNWIPSGKMEHSSVSDRSNEMLIMTPSRVYKPKNVQKCPELERWDFEFFATSKGAPWNPNPAAGEMAADALPADMAVPMSAPAPVPQVVVAAAPVDRAASRLYIRRSDVQKYGYSMDCLGCTSMTTNTTALVFVVGGWRIA